MSKDESAAMHAPRVAVNGDEGGDVRARRRPLSRAPPAFCYPFIRGPHGPHPGGLPGRPRGADCKAAAECFAGSNPAPATNGPPSPRDGGPTRVVSRSTPADFVA